MSGLELEIIPSLSPKSTAAGLLVLPVEIRHQIIRLVLAVPHLPIFFQDYGGPLEYRMPLKPAAWLALLYTCRQLFHDARPILYGANCFTLEEVETRNHRSNVLGLFIRSIGSNAGFLSKLRISFPATEQVDGQQGEIRLREDALRNLELLRKECTGLRTLEASIYGERRYLIEENHSILDSVGEILKEIDSEFRKIASLNTIIVEYCSELPDQSIKNILDSLDWTVKGPNRQKDEMALSLWAWGLYLGD
ncbi:hypothetical protein N7539_008498 [Penicillium diatomitis]|uniref:Uncharacterized protein n=1 Tax=Penicillium diatomitis TaxID=2819901 RepID=A0A9W9WQW8_9EURO|nr:uncharacterized protein N7539_008498 [Penicillium diatomitis]KAJ5471929.1 hypothetical protein N7539_008498 [Penicillium diatomitis]